MPMFTQVYRRKEPEYRNKTGVGGGASYLFIYQRNRPKFKVLFIGAVIKTLDCHRQLEALRIVWNHDVNLQVSMETEL